MRTSVFLQQCVGVFAFSLLTLPAPAALKTVAASQGGSIQYGRVDGQSDEAGAMGAVLRSLHTRYGERPQVGRLFAVRGTESIAAFFSVADRNHGGAPIAGLMIATKPSNSDVEVGVVSDDAGRFPRTLSPMMKTLLGVWHPLSGAHAGGSAPAALHTIYLPDNSASVGLPEGWKVVSQQSGGGTISAYGPRGEQAFLGATFLAMDPRNPYVQRTMAQLRAGMLQNTVYAQANYVPFGADPAQTLIYLIHSSQRRAGISEGEYQFGNMSPVPANGERCVKFSGTADFRDGRGAREMNGVFCEAPPNSTGGWLSELYSTTVPQQYAAEERATMGAILQSLNVNQAVVNAQAAQIAAPVIAQIHAIGATAAAQAQSAHETEDMITSSYYQRWDSLDKRSQEFENYQLGYTVIQDNNQNAHGTFWNSDADALVKSDPNRYEYVNAPNYWKGIDY